MFQGAGIGLWADPNATTNSKTAVVVHDVQINRAAGDGLRISNVPRVEIRNVGVLQPGRNGIAVSAAGVTATVTQSRVDGAPSNGILVASSTAAEVTGNRVSRAGQLANQDRFGMDLNGIRIGGARAVEVRDNHVDTTGYAGVMISEVPSSAQTQTPAIDVRRNRIATFCVHLNDCGAIYINGRQPRTPAPAAIRGSRVVSDNEISDPRASMAGLPGFAGAQPQAKPNAATHRMIGAVYLDNSASGYDVENNRISGSYEPYGWRIFNSGILNGCSREEVRQCADGQAGYNCYTAALDRCNEVTSRGQR
jgi:hypothetical protein